MGFFSVDSRFYRYTILVLICLLTFGSYFCFDIPGALKDDFLNPKVLGLSQLQVNLLYSIYSWPNTVQPFFGGWLVDGFLGIRLGTSIFCFLLVIGQSVFAFGVSIKSFWVMLAGRFIFGLGGETLSVTQSTISARWFKGNELAMAFGIALSFSRVGSAVCFDVEPGIVGDGANFTRFTLALWLGALTCAFSFVACLILVAMDKKGEKHLMAIGNIKPVVDVERVSLKDALKFPLSVWLIYGICVCFYVSVFVFIQNGSDILQNKYSMSKSKAGFIMSLPYTISAAASPFLGILVDRVGRSLTWVSLSCLLLTTAHGALGFTTTIPPIAIAICIGIAYSVCAAALWPSIALVVKMEMLGSAYGLMTALQNTGLAVMPLAVAQLLPAPDASFSPQQYGDVYRWPMLIFAASAGISFILSIALFIVDYRGSGLLNASPEVLAERDAAIEASSVASADSHMSDRFAQDGKDYYDSQEFDESGALLTTGNRIQASRGKLLAKLGIRPAWSRRRSSIGSDVGSYAHLGAYQ